MTLVGGGYWKWSGEKWVVSFLRCELFVKAILPATLSPPVILLNHTDWMLQVFFEWIHDKRFYTNLKNKVQFNISYKGRIQKVIATEQEV